MQKIYLVDGMSLVFRAYYAMQSSRFLSSNGEPTGAIFGFINMLTSFLEKQEVSNISVVFDCSAPTFRHELYPEYKANRAKFPEELSIQLPVIKNFLDMAGITRLEIPGYEADDIIGTLAKKASNLGYQVYCMTSDKDFYQLVEENVFLVRNSRESSDYEVIGANEVKDKMGVLPTQVIDFLALVGDASDNVPGVKGIGEKTAIPLIEEFGTLENIYSNIESTSFDNKSLSSSVYNKLIEGKESAFLSKKLVTIDTNVPIEFNTNDFQIGEPDSTKIDEQFARLGFKQLREKWQKRKISNNISTTINTPESFSEAPKYPEILDTNNKTNYSINYNIISSKNINSLLAKVAEAPLISIKIDTDSNDRNSSNIIGISIAFEENKVYYIPLKSLNEPEENNSVNSTSLLFEQDTDKNNNYEEFAPEKLVLEYVLCDFKNIFENPAIQKCGYDIKNDAYILKRYDINLSPITFDPMIASYVIESNNNKSIHDISERYFNSIIESFSDYNSSNNVNKINRDLRANKSTTSSNIKNIFSDYKNSLDTVGITFGLHKILTSELEKKQLDYVANNIEMPLVEILADMEHTGISIDEKILVDIGYYLASEIENLKTQIYSESKIEFNIDSPKQLGEVLFDKLQLPAYKKNKTGYSTDFQSLSELSNTYPIVANVLTYRQLMKLKTTYIDSLPKLVHPLTQRIHTSYNQTITSTGRLSSTEPNLQNIPIRNEVGREIRRAIIPKSSDDFILSIDYSQIELRVMAYLSGDANLISAFVNGEDVHQSTAATLFNVSNDRVTPEMRKIAKTVNFGIMYGLGAYGLAQRLNISRKESKEIIDNYFERFPGIRNYILKTIEDVRSTGFAKTQTGRRRYFPDINSQNHNIRAAAERAAVNMPVQGLASDIIKIAMIEIYQSIKQYNLYSKMILQVHDELVFEVASNEIDIIADIAYSKMSYAFPLGDVPLGVAMNFGKNWLEAHS